MPKITCSGEPINGQRYVGSYDPDYCALRDPNYVAPEPVVWRYETDAMAGVRQLLIREGYNDTSIDTFKDCLVALERQGFRLTNTSS